MLDSGLEVDGNSGVIFKEVVRAILASKAMAREYDCVI
jgi:hypothetical protein